MTDFSIRNFIEEVGKDARRVGKSYLYQVTFTFSKVGPSIKATPPIDDGMLRKLTFYCNRVNIPGYRSDTQKSTIYGLSYEVVSKIEQDPLWMSFYSDILHKIPHIFFINMRNGPQEFSVYEDGINSSFSPRYKNEYTFDVNIEILDENFKPVAKYTYERCFIRTVQQIALGTDNTSVPEVTVELIYERMRGDLVSGHSRNTVVQESPFKGTGYDVVESESPVWGGNQKGN